ncbi:MAG TPA: sigma-70 family RNA polymerase sigma factor [Planctomycetota bacterium]|nr:sigma-70 family RNA polymerase sigma factor [Planctomycetota bacterium]
MNSSSVLNPSSSVMDSSHPGLDDELVRQYLTGDGMAFETLYARHSARLQIYVAGLTNQWQEAEEIVQEVFLGLTRTLDQYQARGTFTRYLLVVARNKAFERRASQAARRRREDSVAALRSWFTAANPAKATQEAEFGQRVTTALQALPDEQREVVVLKIYENCTFQEIADLTNTPIGTVSSRYNYALEKLRTLLSDFQG